MSSAVVSHVWLDDQGVAWIDDTNTKVIEVVLDKLAYGDSPEEIHFQHPHLSLGQTDAALSYYHDNQTELDADIDRRLAEVDATAAQHNDSPVRRKLRSLGKLP